MVRPARPRHTVEKNAANMNGDRYPLDLATAVANGFREGQTRAITFTPFRPLRIFHRHCGWLADRARGNRRPPS